MAISVPILVGLAGLESNDDRVMAAFITGFGIALFSLVLVGIDMKRMKQRDKYTDRWIKWNNERNDHEARVRCGKW